jgi:DNA-binding beta-propeller fold protein YncE
LNLAPATYGISTGSVTGVNVTGFPTTWVASDSKGTIYFTNLSNTLNYAVPAHLGSATELAALQFAPTGIAVDSVRGRIYLSYGPGNEIVVYSLAGKPLHLIK